MGSGVVHSLVGGNDRGDMVRIQGVELDEIYEFAKRGIVNNPTTKVVGFLA